MTQQNSSRFFFKIYHQSCEKTSEIKAWIRCYIGLRSLSSMQYSHTLTTSNKDDLLLEKWPSIKGHIIFTRHCMHTSIYDIPNEHTNLSPSTPPISSYRFWAYTVFPAVVLSEADILQPKGFVCSAVNHHSLKENPVSLGWSVKNGQIQTLHPQIQTHLKFHLSRSPSP